MQTIAKFVALTLLAASAVAQQPPAAQKTWKSQAEYDLYSAAAKETDARKKVAALDSWKQQFPATDFEQQRLALYADAYQRLNDMPKALATLNEMLALDPHNVQVLTAVLIFTLPPYNQTSPAALENAVKCANAVLEAIEAKPQGTDDAAWTKTKTTTTTLAHTTLGWAAMTRGDNPAAESEFLKALHSDPDAAQVDAWLGNVLRAQKTPEKTSQAFFFYARAATHEGNGALPPPVRQQFDDFLAKAYKGYHGTDEAGLKELKHLAQAQAFPPEGFAVRSETEIAAAKEAELQRANPQLALWSSLRKELTSPNAAQYFDANMKGADVPGGAGGVAAFKGTVLAVKPALRPKELVVAITDATTPEVTLKLDTALAVKPKIGAEVEFDGVPESFAAEPFMVTFQVERSRLKVR